MAGVKENTYALTDLPRVKAHGDITGDDHDTELDRLINETTAAIENYCGRRFLSRDYTHDGTTLPRLDSYGGITLRLPENPVTAVSTLKLDPNQSALTEGWNEDFTIDHDAGAIVLVAQSFLGSPAFPARQVVEITYTAGYLRDSDSPTAAQGWLWGETTAAADLTLAATQQVVWAFNQKHREREGISSRSTEAGTVTYLTSAWLPQVKAVLDRYARIRV
jgi:hypothetical protein